ncbi:hypothetical protein W7K_07980 [Stenotrophomonas geniculata N1]|uniref:Uncharacterized protein n=1 Tax=Stenotrophomonas geniculata N1 TaxID=1167641 RepID=A0A0L8ABK8_9GAMM|nr:hypothetical protein W7K_07980 [Stenotrophomonas geniculata N1]
MHGCAAVPQGHAELLHFAVGLDDVEIIPARRWQDGAGAAIVSCVKRELMFELARLCYGTSHLHGIGSTGIDNAVALKCGPIFRGACFKAARIKQLWLTPRYG